MARAESGVRGKRLFDSRLACEHATELTAARDPEVERAADALRRQGKAMAGGVADEEAAVFRGGTQPMWDEVALVADRGNAEPPGDVRSRLLDGDARIVRAGADAHLVPCGNAPAIAPPKQRAIDDDVERVAAATRVNLEPSGERTHGPGKRLRSEHAAPAESVDDERRSHDAPVRAHAVFDPTLHERALETSA